MIQNDENDIKPLFRTKDQMMSQKQEKKIKNQGKQWFEESGMRYLIKVPVTMNQALGKEMKYGIEQITKSKVLIQESLGSTVVNSNPSTPHSAIE